ncbi:hypothetical protein Vretimale_12361 [Volvox reticuliferus]|nr:hypothetical protein Vretimale_12361 [Volvox reticuliferus]
MDTAKLAVEFARKVGDEQLPRAWSKHTTGTTANRKLTGGTGAVAGTAEDGKSSDGRETAKGKDKKDRRVKDMLLPEEEDPKLQEFLALMQPRFKAKIWANDELTKNGVDTAAAAVAASGQQAHQPNRKRGDTREHADLDRTGAAAPRADDEDDDEDDQYQDWTDVAARARRTGSGDGSEEGEEMLSGSDGGKDDTDEGAGKGGRDEVVINDAVSDLEYLRSRMRRWDEEEEDEEEQGKDGEKGGGSSSRENGQKQGAAKGVTEAAARGDQSGVGTSPRCEAKAAGGGKKAISSKKSGAAAAAKLSLHELVHMDVDAKPGGDDSDREGSDGTYARGDVDMEGAAAAPPLQVTTTTMDGEAEEGIMETGRLFVRNLAYTATETDLSGLFGSFGDLQEVHLVMDRETKRSKGLAYVQYQIPEDAVKAAQQLDGTIYQGRLLHILAAKPAAGSGTQNTANVAGSDGGEPDDPGAKGGRPGTSSFKAQREAQRKADAGNRAAWNTLFMRPDTVADAVAAHYGLSKAALLDPSATGGKGADSVAVRMALGEAQVIAATKHALAEAGVNVEALERAAAASGKASTARSVLRSSTTLLVKNLPYSADEDELAELFGRCGPLARLVLPPARALALVEFTEPQDARAAFRSLAYKKYHHVPLYLEWAPADVFTEAPGPRERQRQLRQQATEAKQPGNKDDIAVSAHEMAGTLVDGDEAEAGAPANPAIVGTIYVKNLAFSTSDGALRKHFDGAVSAIGGSLHSAVVARKKAKDGALQSLGYGFVEVDSEEIAAAVIKKLQGSQLDGHKLVLQLSRARKVASVSAAGGAKTAKKAAGGSQADQDGSTKLVVRNLAFEATKKDIQGLFNPFGHLKSCRLPKKFDGSHRGFAFVEFVTKQEARNALEGVGGTHLYGRRLVVEYAREDDTLDDIRNKTAAKFRRDVEHEEGDAPAKRLKV